VKKKRKKILRREKTRRFLIAAIRARLAAGESDLRIQEDMELSPTKYMALLEDLYKEDAAARFDKPADQSYIDYCLRQEGCIKDLNTLIRKWRNSNQLNAIVGAVRVKSEILDRMVTRGQDFGVLRRVPEQHQFVGGIAIKDLSDKELRGKVYEQLEGLRAAITRFGDVDISEAKPPKPAKLLKPKPELSSPPPESKGGLSKRRKIKRKKQKHAPPKV
jgi:hypothetical protein